MALYGGGHDDNTTCASLLRELQLIWDEVGESEDERDRTLFQLEQECLEVYRRKVDNASHAKVHLHQQLAECEAEISSIVAAIGDRSLLGKHEKPVGTLKQQLTSVQPLLNELRQRKEERAKKLIELKGRIQRIAAEISGTHQESTLNYDAADEQDLSLRRLDEYNTQLHALQQEKKERLQKVQDYISVIHELCAVLGMDFFKIITDVHPSLDDSTACQSKSISNNTLDRLGKTLQALYEEKKQRIQKLQDLGASLIELWNLMDVSEEEELPFQHITSIIGAHEDELTSPGVLSLDTIEQAEVEVERLDQLKSSKMKELVMRRHTELEGIYRAVHMEPDPETSLENFIAIIDSGEFDPSELLASVDELIVKAKEEALSRRDVMEKMDKWMSSCEEEAWLEDYNRDENRYSATRGAHINLKRAEKARVTVSKMPALVDALTAKTKSWEEDRGVPFLYDGVRLLDMLDEYNLLRQEKEEEKRRLRDQKRLQDQLMTEQETLFGSRPSPNKPLSAKKGSNLLRANNGHTPSAANRRLSLQTDLLIPRVNGVTPVRMGGKDGSKKVRPIAPLNYVALSKEDVASVDGSESQW